MQIELENVKFTIPCYTVGPCACILWVFMEA